jgi:hypothetical protein
MFNKFLTFGCLVLSGVALATLDTEHYLENPYKITATNTLESESNRYSENNLKDLDIKTAWCAPNHGNGATLTFVTTDDKPRKTKTLQFFILPGYAKSASLYVANERPKDVKVTVSSSDGTTLVTTNFSLKDEMVQQRFWAYWDAEYPIQDLKIEISINDYYEGGKYSDLCISEFSIVPVIDQSMTEWEKEKINYLEPYIKKGDSAALHALIRLFVVFNHESWLYDSINKAFIYQPENFFQILDVQIPSVRNIILFEALYPGGENYDSKYYSNTDILEIALQLKNSGIQSESLDKFIVHYQDIVKKDP